MNRRLSPLWAGLLLSAMALPAAAQAPAKSLGGGAGSGPVMTRDELRTCLKQKDDLAQRTAAYDAQRKALDTEKTAIVTETESLKATRGNLDQTRGSVEAINARQKVLGEKVDDWNERFKTFTEEGKSGPLTERTRRNLMREKDELAKEAAELDAARGGAKLDPEAAKRYNERAAQVEKQVVDWNRRQAEAVKESENLLQERDLWASECGNRRFREDDEIAIQQGK